MIDYYDANYKQCNFRIMKKIFFISVMVLLVTYALTACVGRTPGRPTTEQSTGEKVTYTCPMHPELLSDKPGKCPICGMTLVVKADQADSVKVHPADTTNDMSGMRM
jgi:hypothetical protein